MLRSILVSLIPDGDFIALTTISRQFGKSQRFLLCVDTLNDFLDGTVPVLYDSDLNSFLRGWYTDAETIGLRITWLGSTCNDQVSGHIERLDLPVSLLIAAMDQPVKYLVHKEAMQCPIKLSPSAQKMVADLDRLERRALSKALRDNWHWSYPEPVTLYADWNDSFYFHTESICGGLCRHADTVPGTDRKPHLRVRYSVHT